MILLDTNVISEPQRREPNARLREGRPTANTAQKTP
jgi:predicted nucleic acid-binding protein